MEQVKQVLIQYWPQIVDYALTFIAYFLVFLFRSKMSGTRRSLTIAFKQHAETVEVTDKRLNEQMQAQSAEVASELTEAKAKYAEAVNKIADLERRLLIAEKALNSFVEEDSDDDTSGKD